MHYKNGEEQVFYVHGERKGSAERLIQTWKFEFIEKKLSSVF